jgi:MYXO-CTERM domain-containing protein
MCRDGLCVPSCGGVSCPLDQFCVDGVCTPDPCWGIRCRTGLTCFARDGEPFCDDDRCAETECPTGRICRDGTCVDSACTGVACPTGERCEDRGGVAVCRADWEMQPDPKPEVDAGVPTDAGPSDGGRGEAGTDVGPDPADAGPVDPRPDVFNLPDLARIQDAALSERDSGAPPADSGSDGGGCNCRAGGRGNGYISALLLLGLLGIRRRRVRRRP